MKLNGVDKKVVMHSLLLVVLLAIAAQALLPFSMFSARIAALVNGTTLGTKLLDIANILLASLIFLMIATAFYFAIKNVYQIFAYDTGKSSASAITISMILIGVLMYFADFLANNLNYQLEKVAPKGYFFLIVFVEHLSKYGTAFMQLLLITVVFYFIIKILRKDYSEL